MNIRVCHSYLAKVVLRKVVRHTGLDARAVQNVAAMYFQRSLWNSVVKLRLRHGEHVCQW